MKKLKGNYTLQELQQLSEISDEIMSVLPAYTNKERIRYNELLHKRNIILYSKDGGYREEWVEYQKHGTPEHITRAFGFLAKISGEWR